MSSNLLSLNPSKMEFLLIGLPAQLPKISDPGLLCHLMPSLHQLPQHAILVSSKTYRFVNEIVSQPDINYRTNFTDAMRPDRYARSMNYIATFIYT